MSMIKHKDPKSGTVYVYSSESYWDKEKKQPRSRRKLIGKLDEETGEIIPTGKGGRRKPVADTSEAETADTSTDQKSIASDILAEKDQTIRELREELRVLKAERKEMIAAMEELSRRWVI